MRKFEFFRNQYAQDSVGCEFVFAIKIGTYSESGDVII